MKKKDIIKQFTKWLENEPRQNWEIERYFEDTVKSFQNETIKNQILKEMPKKKREYALDADLKSATVFNQALTQCKDAVRKVLR